MTTGWLYSPWFFYSGSLFFKGKSSFYVFVRLPPPPRRHLALWRRRRQIGCLQGERRGRIRKGGTALDPFLRVGKQGHAVTDVTVTCSTVCNRQYCMYATRHVTSAFVSGSACLRVLGLWFCDRPARRIPVWYCSRTCARLLQSHALGGPHHTIIRP